MYCFKCGKKKKDCNCSNKEKKAPVSAIISVILLTLIILGGCFLLFYSKDNEILADVFEKEENLTNNQNDKNDKTNQKNKENKTDKDDKNDEVKEEKNKYVTSIKQYVSTVDRTTNFTLYPDGTVKGVFNFCEGFEDYSGTYELDGDKVKLIITDSWNEDPVIEVFKINSDDVATHYSGQEFLPTCCGPDFKLKK